MPLLTNEPNSIFRQQFEGYLREKDIRMDHTIQLGSIPTIQHLVENEVGVTFLPRFAVEEALADGRLVELPVDMAAPTLSPVCAHHKGKWSAPCSSAFGPGDPDSAAVKRPSPGTLVPGDGLFMGNLI